MANVELGNANLKAAKSCIFFYQSSITLNKETPIYLDIYIIQYFRCYTECS